MHVMKTREEEMNEQAEEFHKKYPRVSILFVKFTKEIIARGYQHYSVNAIFERIRWETDVPDVNGKTQFKLSNNHRAWYARKFMETFPEYKGFFRTRPRKSATQLANNKGEYTKTEDFYET